MKRALIVGISGQDGAYLARHLLGAGYEVWGSSRDAQVASFSNLERLGLRESVNLLSCSPTDFRSVLQALTAAEPDEVYNLSGQSSVGLSFDQPVETLESIAVATLNLLECIRFTKMRVRFYNACSSEVFGDTGGVAADETTPFHPRSPYAVAKATAFWEVANYREAYGLYACSGILFNHESPLRPSRFVTRKIVAAACRIAKGSGERLSLGDLSIARDWGWAPEYVEAMHTMLQLEQPTDFVIATGETNRLEDFVAEVFGALELDWKAHVDHDPGLRRPSEIRANHAKQARAAELLGWRASLKMREVARRLVRCELERKIE